MPDISEDDEPNDDVVTLPALIETIRGHTFGIKAAIDAAIDEGLFPAVPDNLRPFYMTAGVFDQVHPKPVSVHDLPMPEPEPSN